MSIDVEREGQVAVITINRPEAHNALDPDHNKRLAAAVADFERDDTLRVAVLTGAGAVSFSTGADLKTLIPGFRTAVRNGESPPWNFGGFTSTPCTKPLVAAINGYALAGGLEMALACDIRVAAPHATLGLPETKWAIIPGAGGTVRLPRTVSMGLALEMILTGEPINAPEALRVGLVNHLYPAETLLEEATNLARLIARRGPLAVRAARDAVVSGYGQDLDAAIRLEHDHFRQVLRSDDAIEGSAAFAEKRDPIFWGR